MWMVIRDLLWENTALEYGRLDSLRSNAGARVGYSAENGGIRLLTTSEYEQFAREFNEALDGRKPVRIRAYDDDNNLYYECVSTSEDDSESFYEWAMWNAGATYTMYEDFRGHWRYLYG